MKTVRTVAELRAALAPERRAGRTIGLVPTMGALHEGHTALIGAAAAQTDVVVMSLFVNPAQFNEAADLAAYPRDEARDAALAEAAGAQLLFAPDAAEVYPPGFATTVSVGPLMDTLEGAHRPGHFQGVATVVTKLLNMVGPDVAYFGQKDAQQLAIVRKLVSDLDLPVRIEGVATVREPDGLALSSRNVHLTPADRPQALALRAALAAAEAAIRRGERDPRAIEAAGREAMTARDVAPEYLAVVDPDTFSPVDRVNGRALVAVAARVGRTRLIDNALVKTADPQEAPHVLAPPQHRP